MKRPVISRGPKPDRDPFEMFGCKVPKASPDTPDRLNPDVTLARNTEHSLDLRMPDGQEIRVWTFKSQSESATFPGPLIRVREGQIVHSRISPSFGTHTIHHHGIEPTTVNDGVGHMSFEVAGNYTYQWQPRFSGTYFYHCHKNTVLHFEMGMYGFLIVDPPQGEGFVQRRDEILRYDVEALWAVDEFDPRWHDRLNHNAGIKCPDGEDAGLNEFRPEYFLISGVASPLTITDPRVRIRAKVGQTILWRVLNAGYTLQRVTLHGLDAEVIETDGRTLGRTPHMRYSEPVFVPAGSPLDYTTGQRHGILVRPTLKGTFLITVEFRDWVSGQLYHTAQSVIEVD